MDDNKKKLNITVKKTVSPFLFPDSNANKDKEKETVIVTSIQTQVPTAELAEKRKRGRPRLNKDSTTGVPHNNQSVNSKIIKSDKTNEIKENIEGEMEVEGDQDSDKVLKKRGRKPKNQNMFANMSDRIYGLKVSKTPMDLENLENLSYIVNLKITKEKVDEIIQEINDELTGKLVSREKASSSLVIDNDKNKDNKGSFNRDSDNDKAKDLKTDLPQLLWPNLNYSATELTKANSELNLVNSELTSKFLADKNTGNFLSVDDKNTGNFLSVDDKNTGNFLSVDDKNGICPHCNMDGHKSLQLSSYDQVDVDVNELGQGYLDCYVGDLMPGFIHKDEDGNNMWPISSKYPCRNCEELFTTTPAGLVQKIFGDYEVDPMKCKFFLYLNFCNWACAARYAFDRMPDWINQHNMMNLCYNTIMKKMDPKHTWRKVDMAPELGNLQRNGGALTIEQYRNLTQTNITYTIYLAPLIPLKMTLEETSGASSTRAKNRINATNGKEKVVLLDKSRVIKAEQSIKNRKESNKGNTIERLMKVEIR